MSSAGRVMQRLRSRISPLTAAVVTLALFTALLVGLAMPTDRGAGAQPTPDIATVAIDLDPTGNTATNIGGGGPGIDPGDIQSAVGNIGIGDTLTFDIVVDSVPAPGIFGVGLEVIYDPAIVEVTAVNRFGGPPSPPGQNLLQYSAAGAAPFGGNDPTPDTDGSFRADSVDLGGTNETGPGKVLDVTIKCIAIGTTTIALTDTSTGGGSNAGILNTFQNYSIGIELEAFIGCGAPVVTPTPTEIPALTPTPTVTPNATPPPADIAIVAVDLDPTGNTATHIGDGGAGIDDGDIQSSLDNVATGSSVTFDIVVDAVPSPGILGVGLEVNYDPAIVRVTAANLTAGLLQFSSGVPLPFAFSDIPPDTDGSFRVDSVDFGATDETGPGKVLDVTVECIAAGTTPITLTDGSTGGGENAGILVSSQSRFPFTIGTELEASIVCVGPAVTPTQTPTPTSTPPPTPTPGPPGSAEIAIVAVDLDPTGNTATSIGAGGAGIDPGDIQSTAGSIDIGSTVTFDVVVDSVPSPGIFGVGLEVNYDETIVKVTAANLTTGLLQFSSGTPFPFSINDPLPDTDGSFRVDSIDIGVTDETGPGKVVEVTVECVATGTTPITLTDSHTSGPGGFESDNAGILDQFGAFTIGKEIEAFIGCGGPVVTPTPTDTPTITPTLTPTPTPPAGGVKVAVDLDPSGNTATSVGTIENTLGNVELNAPFQANITVEGVPAPGIFGVGAEIRFDPDVVRVTGLQPFTLVGQVLQYSSGAPVPFGSVMASPGSLRVDAVDLSATNETGDGVVYVFEIECIAIGVSLIQLTDVSTGGGANAGILNTTEAFAVASETDGVVGCEVPAIAPVMGSISGTVTDEATGDPLADICVSAPGPGFGFAETDASGNYILSELWAGNYRVSFQDCGAGLYLFESFTGNVPVSVGVETTGINAALVLAGSMSGTVTDEATGDPLAKICVSLTGRPGSTLTDAAGAYTVSGLFPRDYRVTFSDCVPPQVYAEEWYDDQPDLLSADSISVSPGVETTGIDAALAQIAPTTTSAPPTGSVSNLRVGSANVALGGVVTIPITADATNLGSYRIDVQYDSTLVTATQCTSSEGVCSVDVVAPSTVRLNGSKLTGIMGNDVVLGTITFLAGSAQGTAAVTVNPATQVLLDTLGNTLTVAATNGAITIGAGGPSPAASTVPTPTPTATATPAPGPTPGVSNLRVGSASVAIGGVVTIPITADATNLGSYRVDVQYDSALVTATECMSSSGVCSVDVVAQSTVRLNGSNLAGISGTNVVLGTMTFLAGSAQGTAAVTVNPATQVLLDTLGNTLTVTATNGAITIELAPTPTPTATPSVPSTPVVTATPGFDGDDGGGAGGGPDVGGGGGGGANSLAISPTSSGIGVGATTAVELVSVPPAESLSAWVIEIDFDPAVVRVDDCAPATAPPSSLFVSACEAIDKGGGTEDDTVVAVGAIIFPNTDRGLDDETTLATITFSAVGSVGQCSDLTINVISHLGPDPTGSETNPATTDGEICIAPPAGPPMPTPAGATATPVGAPTVTSTPTATPTATATPTTTTAATAATPAATPATPAATLVPMPTPTPTAAATATPTTAATATPSAAPSTPAATLVPPATQTPKPTPTGTVDPPSVSATPSQTPPGPGSIQTPEPTPTPSEPPTPTPTAVPTLPSSATPVPTTPPAPTDTLAPAPTALAATQAPAGLPTSGGPGDDSGSSMLVLTLGLLLLAFVVIAWRASVRLSVSAAPPPRARRSGMANRWDWG